MLFFLAFTVYQKSRAGAVVLTAYWLWNIVDKTMQGNFGLIMLVFLYCYWMGAKATFDLHRLLSGTLTTETDTI